MFGALVRVAAVLVAGSLITLTLSMVGGEIVDTQEDLSGGETANSNWQTVVITWFPAVIIAMVAAILIGSAIVRRRRVVP